MFYQIKDLILTPLLFGVFLLSGGITSYSQQTIYNVPSSDVLDKGKVYFELDGSFKFNNHPAVKRFSSFVPRIVAGIGKNVEIGLNVNGNINPGDDQTTLTPAVKWRVYNNEKKGFQIVVGNNLFVPVRHKSYNLGNYSYAQVSKTFKKTRITGGGYYFTKNVVSTAARGGGQFALEQTINSKLNFNADWFTGKHSLGYFTPGFAYKFTPKVTGYLGYSIGNGGVKKGNHFFYAEIGINLN